MHKHLVQLEPAKVFWERLTLVGPILNARGYFWWGDEPIPHGHFAPNTAVTGALEISTTGRLQLNLDATLPRRPDAGPLAALFDKEPITRAICGILSEKNQYVRLTDLQSSGARVNTNGPSNEKMRAHCCLLSRTSFATNREPSITSIQFSLKGYEDWLNLRSISLVKGRRSLTARYTRPRRYSWKINIANLVLEYDLLHPFPGRSSELSLTELVSLRMTPKQRINLNKTLELALRVEDLMILLTDSERGLDYPTLKLQGHPSPVEVYFPRLERPQDEVNWVSCWTSFPQIAGDFGAIVESWLSKHELFGPGFHLYLGNRRRAQMYPEHRFASLVWGLESLHRKIYPPKANAALIAKVNRILGQIASQNDRKWVEKDPRNAGEPSLANRLFDIFNTLPFGLNRDELRRFSDRCGKRRNDISHFGGMREVGLYSEFLTEIIVLNDVLDLLYHARLLQEIGVSDAHIRAWFLNGFRSNRIRNNLATVDLKLPETDTFPPAGSD